MKKIKVKKIIKEYYGRLAQKGRKLGISSPVQFAKLKKGEVVLDLGSGVGSDCIKAAEMVGREGEVIGIDMSKEMILKAKKITKSQGFKNIEFIEGEIEKLPIKDNSIDVVISDCVINLSSEKQKVFNEAYRVLKPKGRVIISDLTATKDLPQWMRKDEDLYAGCIGGTVLEKDYVKMMKNSGFKKIKILERKANSCCQASSEIISSITFSASK